MVLSPGAKVNDSALPSIAAAEMRICEGISAMVISLWPFPRRARAGVPGVVAQPDRVKAQPRPTFWRQTDGPAIIQNFNLMHRKLLAYREKRSRTAWELNGRGWCRAEMP